MPPGGLAGNGYVLRVTAKSCNIITDPFKRLYHIHGSVIAGTVECVFTVPQRRVGEPAERPKAVVDGDDYHVRPAGHGCTDIGIS